MFPLCRPANCAKWFRGILLLMANLISYVVLLAALAYFIHIFNPLCEQRIEIDSKHFLARMSNQGEK